MVFAREVEGIQSGGNRPFWTDSGGLFQLPSSSSSYLPANTLSLSSGDSLFLRESDNSKSVSRRHRRERSAQKSEGRSATTLNLFMPPPNRFCLNVPRLVKLRERKSRRAAITCYAEREIISPNSRPYPQPRPCAVRLHVHSRLHCRMPSFLA